MLLKNLKILCKYVIEDLHGDIVTFHGNEFRKRKQIEFRIEKPIKKKGEKLYIKQKGCDNLFNNWKDREDIA